MSRPVAIDESGVRWRFDTELGRWVENPGAGVVCDRPLLDPEELRDRRRQERHQAPAPDASEGTS